MELFKPSKRILEIICDNEENPLVSYEIFPFTSDREMEEICMLSEVGLFEKIIHFYAKDGLALNEETKRRLDYQGIHNVVGELFKNWSDHSPEGSNLLVGFFFASKGVCYGVHDGGEFFKKPGIKKQLENRITFEKFDPNPRGSCANSGFNNHIFPYSDFIEVDSDNGILYCVQIKENIIAPEGEHGSEYCYNLRQKKGLLHILGEKN